MTETSTPGENVVQADGSQEPSQTSTPEPADQQPSQEPNQQTDDSSDDDSNKQTDGDNAQAPAQDDDLAEWAGKQGIDLENPSPEQAKVIAKRLRDTQKAFTTSQQALKAAQEFSQQHKDSQLERVSEIEDPIERQTAYNTVTIQNMQTQLSTERFFGANPDYIPVRQEMAKIVADDIARYGEHMNDYWQDNLEKLGELAKGINAESTKQEAYDQGRQEERESVARQQQISTPQTHATAPASAANKPITSIEQIRSMSPEERRSRQEEIFSYMGTLRG